MTRSVGIMAYGSPDDRLKLEVLAKLAKTSSSQWIINEIRRRYAEASKPTIPAPPATVNKT